MSLKLISPKQMSELLGSGKSVALLDVRTPAEYARVHAAGAQSLPLDQLDPAALASKGLGRNEPVYVICHSGSRSAKACQSLLSAGLESVVSVEGGTAAWEAAGLPVERSKSGTISIERQVRIAAGLLVLLFSLLAFLVHPAIVALSALVGAGLIFAGITDSCAMGLLLMKMPWNRTASR